LLVSYIISYSVPNLVAGRGQATVNDVMPNLIVVGLKVGDPPEKTGLLAFQN